MDITEVIKRKEELQEKFLTCIEEFEKLTGTVVYKIDLDHVYTVGRRSPDTVGLVIEALIKD